MFFLSICLIEAYVVLVEGVQAIRHYSLPSFRGVVDKNITFYHIRVFFLSLILIFVNAMLC